MRVRADVSREDVLPTGVQDFSGLIPCRQRFFRANGRDQTILNEDRLVFEDPVLRLVGDHGRVFYQHGIFRNLPGLRGLRGPGNLPYPR